MRKGCAPTSKTAISPHESSQFLTLDHHFVRKGCAQTCEIASLLHVWTSKRMSQNIRPPMPCRRTKSTILPQFLTIEARFVRKGCIWVGTPKKAAEVVKSQFYRSFWRSKLISCEMVATEVVKSQFHRSFWRSKLISCEMAATEVVKSQFHAVFGDRSSFRAKWLPPRV